MSKLLLPQFALFVDNDSFFFFSALVMFTREPCPYSLFCLLMCLLEYANMSRPLKNKMVTTKNYKAPTQILTRSWLVLCEAGTDVPYSNSIKNCHFRFPRLGCLAFTWKLLKSSRASNANDENQNLCVLITLRAKIRQKVGVLSLIRQ